ncbi:MAG TPA: thioredoxin [Phototrophicaceae bacterium]|nr:thioredoxin [Phototrophicaceae bacterium]
MVRSTFEVTSANFSQTVLQSAQPILVEFGADWCPPCKMLAPTIHALAAKYEGKLAVGMIDSDAEPELVQRYGVMGLPTLILFQNGQPVKQVIGFQPRERLEALITPFLESEKA